MGALAIPIASLAIAAAGTGVGIAADESANNKANQSTADVLAQEQALEQEAKPVVDTNIQASSAKAAKPQISAAAEKAMGGEQALQSLPATTALPSTPASTVTDTRTNAEVGQNNQAAAQLAGYSGWQNQQSINDQQANNQIGILGTLGSNAAAGLPLALQADQQQTAAWQAAGSLLNGIGGAGLTYGMMKYGMPSSGAGNGSGSGNNSGSNSNPITGGSEVLGGGGGGGGSNGGGLDTGNVN